MRSRRGPIVSTAAGALLCLLLSAAASARADGVTEKRRAQFAQIHLLAIAPPFFGTGRLAKSDPKAGAAPSNPKLTEYLDHLKKLQDRTRTMVPERLTARTHYQVVPPDKVDAALKALDLTPEKLYQNAGRMKGTKFAAPDPDAVRRLATQLHADAVVLDVMDEPRRSPDRLFFDPLGGIGISEAHVSAKIGFWVFLADGTEIYQRVSDVVQPRTKIGTREFVYADWQEANDLAIEDFLDELDRYIPEKK